MENERRGWKKREEEKEREEQRMGEKDKKKKREQNYIPCQEDRKRQKVGLRGFNKEKWKKRKKEGKKKKKSETTKIEKKKIQRMKKTHNMTSYRIKCTFLMHALEYWSA